jgi:DNA (cytosine-5)-methyltransferase 1
MLSGPIGPQPPHRRRRVGHRSLQDRRSAAGHTRVRADVARFDLTAFAGLVWLLIMSPPCQAWSRSGKRKGILDQPAIFAHAMRVTAAGEWIDYADAGPLPAGEGDEGGTWHDARSPLVLEVLRWVLAVQPANICLEQVPDVLPFWELIARWLRGQGYSVWAGCLSSERYGVPQTRERAILIASRERAVSAPPATHTAYDSRLADGGKWHGTDGDLFGGGLEPWVSMAEALGWVPASVVNTRGDRQTPAATSSAPTGRHGRSPRRPDPGRPSTTATTAGCTGTGTRPTPPAGTLRSRRRR